MQTFRSSRHGTAETNPTSDHEVAASIPSLAQWVRSPALLWLWRRLAATALIRALAWEPPYAAGVALNSKKKKKKKKKKKRILLGRILSVCMSFLIFIYLFIIIFLFNKQVAAPAAYGSSQARG